MIKISVSYVTNDLDLGKDVYPYTINTIHRFTLTRIRRDTLRTHVRGGRLGAPSASAIHLLPAHYYTTCADVTAANHELTDSLSALPVAPACC